MDADEIAESFRAPLANMHAAIDALPAGSQRAGLQRMARVAHGALETLRDRAADHGLVQPFSGGDPKPPTP